jgi:hypothetical protein
VWGLFVDAGFACVGFSKDRAALPGQSGSRAQALDSSRKAPPHQADAKIEGSPFREALPAEDKRANITKRGGEVKRV